MVTKIVISLTEEQHAAIRAATFARGQPVTQWAKRVIGRLLVRAALRQRFPELRHCKERRRQ